MSVWLWAAVAVLSAVVAILLIKIYLLQKSAREIAESFADRLITDTNTLIDISSRDRHMRRLAADINVQIRHLRDERRRYQQGDTELKNAVTGISHDLRTPLTALFGYLDLLEQEEKSDAIANYVSIIRNRAEMLRQLTEELFRYSVIIAAGDSFKVELVNIGSVLEESAAAFYATLTERGIVPNITMPAVNVVRDLDRAALSRVFSNLLANAVKYSDGDLDITLTETGEITFSNTARGLDRVQVGRLFDRFYTVEAARKSTGLGLSIAKSLVEQMGGSIAADYEDERLCVRVIFSAE